MRKYHYLVLFWIGFFVLWPFVLHKLYMEQNKNTEAFAEESMAEPQKESILTTQNKTQQESAAEKKEAEVKQEEKESVPIKQEPAIKEQEEAKEELPPELFFQDTLFIGDSRTMGLSEYSDLGNAVIFADSGMSIYRLYSLKNGAKDQPVYLEDILAEKQYRKIYLMLGINELGYAEKKTIERYETEVLKLRERQPKAKIVLAANLHVTAAHSEKDSIFNNEGIDRINESIRQIAEKYGFSYIDVNELFDDEDGGLNPEYTHDEVHVLGKYYQQWADWIRKTGI